MQQDAKIQYMKTNDFDRMSSEYSQRNRYFETVSYGEFYGTTKYIGRPRSLAA
jgi:hypothetical protein